jgi:exopolysaccharide biosynthesis polyprenyl glycosylphosphotransferase
LATLSLARTLPDHREFNTDNVRWIQIAYVLTDIFFVSLSALLVSSLRSGIKWFSWLDGNVGAPHAALRPDYMALLVLYTGFIVLFCKGLGLYRTPRDRSAIDESLAVLRAVGMATIAVAVFIFVSKLDTSRLFVGSTGVLNVVTLSGWRWCKRRAIEHRLAKGYGTRNVLIIGADQVGQELARYFEKNKHLGYSVRGFLDQNHSSEPRILGRIEHLSQVARAQFIDELFITIPSERELVKAIALEARKQRLDVKVVPELYDGLAWRAPIYRVGELPVMSLHWEPIPVLGLAVKRTMDVILSSLTLLVLSPLLLITSISIKLDSPGPVLYWSYRVGRKGRKFVCYKFRTMVANADALKNQLRHLNERQGPLFKLSKDPRLTRVGSLLRKYSIDELPQLWNVLKGDMSLVGPRPPSPDECDQYNLDHLRRLDVTPGLTGLWQIKARRDPSFEKYVALDLEYIENWDLWTDIKILMQTVPVVLQGSGQ